VKEMKFTIDLSSIKVAINNVKSFTSETHIKLEKKMLVIKEMSLDSSAFYQATIKGVEVEGEGDFDVFINAEHLGRILKSMGKAETATFEYNKGILTVESGKKKFEIPVYDDASQNKPIPKVPVKLLGRISSGKLSNIVDSAEVLSKYVNSISFKVENKELNVDCSKDNYKYKETIAEFETDSDETVEASYAIKWLNSIADCLNSDTVEFGFSNDSPLVIVDSDDEKIKQRFILAHVLKYD
jgi:hypothetical protein